jgi:hypothetical protein
MPRWPPPTYRMEIDLHAPLPFVYRWCTDYRADDAGRAGDRYERWVIERSAKRVVFEDLWAEKDGWRWRRYVVTLNGPRSWHADSVANYRDASIDYRLTERPEGRTRLELTVKRRPVPPGAPQPGKKEFESDLRRMWLHFRRALEADYKSSRVKRRRRH